LFEGDLQEVGDVFLEIEEGVEEVGKGLVSQ
jgi:hypothetical protein